MWLHGCVVHARGPLTAKEYGTHAIVTTLELLDDLLIRLRLAQTRPLYRRRMLAAFTELSGLGELRVLRTIERAGREGAETSIRDVSDYLGVEHSTASRAVRDVVDKGWAQKEVSTVDARRTVLQLTDSGAALLADATSRRLVVLEEATSDWSQEDLAMLAGFLERLASGFESLSEP